MSETGEQFTREHRRLGFTVGSSPTPTSPMPDATPSENEDLIRRLHEHCLNDRRLDRLPDFIADEYVGVRGEAGPAGFEATVRSIIEAFPDIRWTVEDLVADGDRVSHPQSQGTIRGEGSVRDHLLR